jgi:hypothetical protein
VAVTAPETTPLTFLDFKRCRLPPFQHQREDVCRMLRHPYLFITSEMRTGKSKIVVDAAQFMFEQDVIDRVIVVAPAPVRDVWFDRELGEFAKHLWLDLPANVYEYHTKNRLWQHGPTVSPKARKFTAIVTNYEFLRAASRLVQIKKFANKRTLLVLDESSFVKTHSAQQTKACMQLRKLCGRVVLLNGTPIFHSPLDLFSQANILSPDILECPYITHFRSRYAIMEPVRGRGGMPLKDPYGKNIEQVAGWTNLDDLQRRFAPVTVRRLQKECLDLPPKLDPVTLTAPMEPAAWRAYKEMRDEMVVWLQSGVAVSASAAVKTLRLSQITSGYLGGIEDDPDNASGEPLEVGRAKLDVLLWFIEQRLAAEPTPKLVVWCRFRAEMFRVLREVKAKFPQFHAGSIQGSQHRDERHAALALLKPETSPNAPVFVVGIEGTGSFGLDMTASHTCVTSSSGYSPGRTAQTLDRVYGPGQTEPVAYYEIMATGPQGQWTIDHAIAKAKREGENIATWTAAAWVKALKAEG